MEGAKRKMVVDLPGVGENLQNEGYLTMTFKRNKSDSFSPVLHDLYAGGKRQRTMAWHVAAIRV